MLIPVKCFTCGTVIGDKYLFYQKRVYEIKIERKINPEVIQYLDESRIDKTVEGEVLDFLKLTKMCCRRHMLTHVNIF
jgi:DNA-directed RNA polymerase subunit N (RpoN/RPB10)